MKKTPVTDRVKKNLKPWLKMGSISWLVDELLTFELNPHHIPKGMTIEQVGDLIEDLGRTHATG